MRVLGIIVTAAMVVAIGHGLTAGDLTTEGSAIVDLAWGRVSLADIYTGVLVLGCWIVWRERSFLRSLPWLVLLVVGGNFGVGPYLLWISRVGRSTEDLLVGERRGF